MRPPSFSTVNYLPNTVYEHFDTSKFIIVVLELSIILCTKERIGNNMSMIMGSENMWAVVVRHFRLNINKSASRSYKYLPTREIFRPEVNMGSPYFPVAFLDGK